MLELVQAAKHEEVTSTVARWHTYLQTKLWLLNNPQIAINVVDMHATLEYLSLVCLLAALKLPATALRLVAWFSKPRTT